MKELLFVLVMVIIACCCGCAGVHTYSSNEERCPDGCWTEMQTRHGNFWCRREDGETVCHPER